MTNRAIVLGWILNAREGLHHLQEVIRLLLWSIKHLPQP